MTGAWRPRVAAWLLGVVLLAACASPPAGGPPTAAAPVHLTLLQVNDVYSLEPVDGGRRGGLARLAAAVKAIRAENPNTLFALAGDVISPSPMSTMLRGEPMIAVFNAVYTVAVIDYLVRGGDGVTAFRDAPVLVDEASGPPLSVLVLGAIAEQGTIAPAADGRIQARGD